MNLYKNFSPTVSIILPTYNRENLLPNAISSVVRQSYTAWELIVVDDGSGDNTFEVVNEFMKSFENIRYLKHLNRGVALSINTGVKCAAGKYVTFLGSDDCYKRDHLEIRMKVLENNPELDLIHGGVHINGDPYVQDKSDLKKKVHLSECIIGGTIFVKKEMLLELGGFSDLSYSAESDLFERAVKQRAVIERVDFPTYVYNRGTPGSITNSVVQS